MSIRTHRTRILGAVGAVLLIAGVSATVVAVRAQRSPPQPPPAAASPVNVVPSVTPPASDSTVPGPAGTAPTGAPGSTPAPQPTTRGPILDQSIPTRLQIPAIGVDSMLNQIGLNPQGEISTPPLDKDSRAYWLSVSPTPGQLGPSTIIGHVDSAAYGPGVFFKLGGLRQTDTIQVTRSDGQVAVFEVERVVEYKKSEFPTDEVYGNIDHAGLRLITCGGDFDSSTRSYESNIVAYASLVSAHGA
jgi:hypothetical protein